MPSITLTFGANGPLLQVMIGLSTPHSEALRALGKAPPAYVQGTFLVDTGASGTCVDPELVKPLGLHPTGEVNIQTPSTNGETHACYTYDVSLIVPSSRAADAPFMIEALPVMETGLRAQGIDGLIGRDVLARCVLVADGPSSIFILSY